MTSETKKKMDWLLEKLDMRAQMEMQLGKNCPRRKLRKDLVNLLVQREVDRLCNEIKTNEKLVSPCARMHTATPQTKAR